VRTANLGTFNAIAEARTLSFTQIKALCALEADGEERSVKALAQSLGVAAGDEPRCGQPVRARPVERDEDPADRG